MRNLKDIFDRLMKVREELAKILDDHRAEMSSEVGGKLSINLDELIDIETTIIAMIQEQPELIVAVVDVILGSIYQESAAEEKLNDVTCETYNLPFFMKMFKYSNVSTETQYAFLIDKKTMKVLNSYE